MSSDRADAENASPSALRRGEPQGGHVAVHLGHEHLAHLASERLEGALEPSASPQLEQRLGRGDGSTRGSQAHAQVLEAWFWDDVYPGFGYTQLGRVVGLLCDYSRPQVGSCEPFAMAFSRV